MSSENYRAALKRHIDRLENLEMQRKEIAADRKDILDEAKAEGFDTKAIREILKERQQSKIERDELEQVKDTYKIALGMLTDD
ncbi:MAG: GapR family DNA-binding domain-containing protein [Pseudomonadota bacterium]